MEKLNITIDPALLGMIDFGVGLYHFVISLIPPSLQIVSTIAGFEADRDKAIEELNRAITSGCVWAPVAFTFLISLKQFFLDEKDEALKDLAKLQEIYPDSILTCYFSGVMSRANGKPADAIKYFEQIAKIAPNNEKMLTTMHYQIGYAHYLLNEWEGVITHFEKFLARPIKESQDKALRPFAAYILGFAYWSLQDKTDDKLVAKINTLYTQAKDWVRPDETYDKFAKRKMTEFSEKKTFDQFDSLLLCAESLREGMQYDRSLEVLQEMEKILQKPENAKKREFFAIYYFLMGGCLKGLKQYQEAEGYLRKAIGEDGKVGKENWVVPMSWLTFAEMNLEMKNWSEAAVLLDKIKDYKDYDWEKMVAVRVYGHRQTISKKLQKK